MGVEMPIYAFKCFKCNAQRNVHFGFDDKHELECECGNAMSKVIGATPAIFRGNGWGGSK
jgi:putative FmdB family regulatory protein